MEKYDEKNYLIPNSSKQRNSAKGTKKTGKEENGGKNK